MADQFSGGKRVVRKWMINKVERASESASEINPEQKNVEKEATMEKPPVVEQKIENITLKNVGNEATLEKPPVVEQKIENITLKKVRNKATLEKPPVVEQKIERITLKKEAKEATDNCPEKSEVEQKTSVNLLQDVEEDVVVVQYADPPVLIIENYFAKPEEVDPSKQVWKDGPPDMKEDHFKP